MCLLRSCVVICCLSCIVYFNFSFHLAYKFFSPVLFVNFLNFLFLLSPSYLCILLSFFSSLSSFLLFFYVFFNLLSFCPLCFFSSFFVHHNVFKIRRHREIHIIFVCLYAWEKGGRREGVLTVPLLLRQTLTAKHTPPIHNTTSDHRTYRL